MQGRRTVTLMACGSRRQQTKHTLTPPPPHIPYTHICARAHRPCYHHPHPRRYDLATEFGEALEHSMDRGKNTKIVLKVSDVGVQY